MKKTYFQPATEVVGVVMESQILAGSGDPAPVQGVHASRSGYGIETAW